MYGLTVPVPVPGKCLFMVRCLDMIKFIVSIGNQVKKEHSAFGNIGQWTGVLLMTFGFLYLAHIRADKFTLLLNAGCIIFTLATKLKHERRT